MWSLCTKPACRIMKQWNPHEVPSVSLCESLCVREHPAIGALVEADQLAVTACSLRNNHLNNNNNNNNTRDPRAPRWYAPLPTLRQRPSQ